MQRYLCVLLSITLVMAGGVCVLHSQPVHGFSTVDQGHAHSSHSHSSESDRSPGDRDFCCINQPDARPYGSFEFLFSDPLGTNLVVGSDLFREDMSTVQRQNSFVLRTRIRNGPSPSFHYGSHLINAPPTG
ncbi:MAG: hypothetical protein ABEK50_18780 [bacterium]